MKTGIELIAEERQRQIEKEGWTPEHDDDHKAEDLMHAAACYALPPDTREMYVTTSPRYGHTMLLRWLWPWQWIWWKPTPGNIIRDLVKAGALIAAAIDWYLRKLEREKKDLEAK